MTLIPKICCSIVEERGLDIVGIYRVPGNSLAVTYLTEQVSIKIKLLFKVTTQTVSQLIRNYLQLLNSIYFNHSAILALFNLLKTYTEK